MEGGREGPRCPASRALTATLDDHIFLSLVLSPAISSIVSLGRLCFDLPSNFYPSFIFNIVASW